MKESGKWQVAVALADLRREPLEARGFQQRDALQETQLLFGEEVRVLELLGPWARVEATEQLYFNADGRWQGYPGWILRDQLVEVAEIKTPNIVVHAYSTLLQGQPNFQMLFGTRLHAENYPARGEWQQIALTDGRSGAVATSAVSPLGRTYLPNVLWDRATPFLGTSYFWGGCSSNLQQAGWPRSGVDCSSLMHLLYRTMNVSLPRNAHDQWLHCKKIASHHVKEGDLVFTAPCERTSRMDHVMLYVGEERLLEASLSAGIVRYITFKEKLGLTLEEMRMGKQPNDVVVGFGRAEDRFLPPSKPS